MEHGRMMQGGGVAGLVRATQGRRAILTVAAVLACVLWCLFAAAPVRADEAGYLTLSGVAGVDETTAYATFSDAVAALAACDASAQQDGGQSASIVVHGAVDAGEGGAYGFAYPVDGATVALVGSGEGSFVTVADGTALSLENATGSLVVRGVGFTGSVSLVSRDDLVVESCSFDRGLTCRAGGSVGASGNLFSAAVPGTGCALSATLAGERSTFAFTGNEVAGFGCGVTVTCEASGGTLARVTSNSFDLAAGEGVEGGRTSAVRFAGGPWAAGSVACDGNSFVGVDVLATLDATFSMQVATPEGIVARSVAAGDLDVGSIESLFELVGADASPEDMAIVGLDAVYDGTPVASAAAAVFAPAGEGAAPAGDDPTAEPASDDAVWDAASPDAPVAEAGVQAELATVAYDANGATAGAVPAAVSAPVGSSVTVETMGSLVYAGYVFEGWNTAADGSGVFYAAGQVFSLQGDTVLYAQWAPTGTVATVAVASEGDAAAGAAA